MEVKNIQAFLPLMHSIGRCHSNSERNILFSHLDNKSLNFVCHWLGVGCRDPSVLKLDPKKVRKLRKLLARDKDKLRYLTSKKGKIVEKRKLARQSGEGLGVLLGVLAPILINLVKTAIEKSKGKQK